MAKNGDSNFDAVNRTGNSTGMMGEGEIKGGGRGFEQVNKPNPYGPGPLTGPKSVGGSANSSDEDYS